MKFLRFASFIIFFLIFLLLLLFLMGCEIVTYDTQPRQTYSVVTSVHEPLPPPTSAADSYTYKICYEEPPYYFAAVWCEYSFAGTCCAWEFIDGYGDICEEVWCYWDSICGWEFDEYVCYGYYYY